MADSLAQLVDELYTVPPESFVATRDERLRSITDKSLAAAVKALRKPTVAAWAVNILVRSRREQVEQFVTLGPELAAAQRELDGAALQGLSVRRQRVVHALVREARELAADAGHPIGGAAAYEVESTLHAALADPAVAGRLLEARLLRSESYAGLGPLPDADDRPRLRSVAPQERAAKPDHEDAVRARERKQAEQLLAQAESALEEVRRRAREASKALEEADGARSELEDRAANLRDQLADVERRTAEVDLDRRRLGKIVERTTIHLTRAREQVTNAARRVERSSS